MNLPYKDRYLMIRSRIIDFVEAYPDDKSVQALFTTIELLDSDIFVKKGDTFEFGTDVSPQRG